MKKFFVLALVALVAMTAVFANGSEESASKSVNEKLSREELSNICIAFCERIKEAGYYPMIYASGHGQIRFKDFEINTLLTYLDNGGFLLINDSYGMEKYVRREIKRLFPDREFQLLPKDHPIFHMVYDFPEGLPKIHEHDDKPPAAYAVFDKGRMKVLYLLESDIGDGLEDAGIHKVDTPEIREKAMKMAINILMYAMMQ